MALQKALNIYNQVFNYHMISGVDFSKLSEKIVLKISSYKDYETRQGNAGTFPTPKKHVIEKSDIDENIFNAFASECYRVLKMPKPDDEGNETNIMAGSVDVIE